MTTTILKETALYQKHVNLGAKIVPFAGYKMPLQYTGLTEEHNAVRNHVGLFDVSHMGEFILKGEKALDLVQKVTSNDASKLTDGKVQYSCLTNEEGGIIDDLLVYRITETTYMLVVNASNIQKDWDWIKSQNSFNVEMNNISDRTTLLALQGPKAAEVLEKITDIDVQNMPYYTFIKGEVAGYKNILVSTTGYTGSGGFEIYFDNEFANTIWDKLLEVGKEHNITPAGLAARDTLRLEMGFCLYGNDINDLTSPLEAGLGWITKLAKPNFVAKSILEKQKAEGVKRKLVAFETVERGIPRKDYEICDEEGNNIGFVTSGTMSPSLNKGIGLGYVKKEFSKSETDIFIKIRNKNIRSKVVKLPFYKA